VHKYSYKNKVKFMAEVLVTGKVSGTVGKNMKRGSIVVSDRIVVSERVGDPKAPFGGVYKGMAEGRMGKRTVEDRTKGTVVIDGDIKGDITIETTPEGKDVVVIDGDVLGNIEGGTKDVEVRVNGNVIGQCGVLLEGTTLTVKGDVGEPSEKFMEGGSININPANDE
jgi:glutamate synthase domain-containing protein 3